MKAKSDKAEKQLESFINKFEPKHRSLIRSVRKELRKRFPTTNELAYDNYNFFVIGYGPSDRRIALFRSRPPPAALGYVSSTARVCRIRIEFFSAKEIKRDSSGWNPPTD